MELSTLVGEHEFSGIETGVINMDDTWGDSQSCNYVKFTLDGVHYMAVEDPEDGYRSCCRELVTSDEPPKNSFQPIRMVCTMKDNEESDWGCDILVLTDSVTGEVVLEIGTMDYNDYYPYYHFYYHPEGMACNQIPITDEEFERLLFS